MSIAKETKPRDSAKMVILGQNHLLNKKFRIFLLRFNKGHRLTFFSGILSRSVPLQRNASSLYTCYKISTFSPLFCASLAQSADLSLAYMPVKFYPDPLMFAEVIREKPIVSK